jgi:hypothetical protein
MTERGADFAWQEGYGAFSVSASNLAAVEKYIHNQAKHHKRITFEQEFLSLLKKHGIDYDPENMFLADVPHLRCSGFSLVDPGLPAWANSFRASGAG